MRDIGGMSHEQILALKDDEIQRIYDFMCAEAGLRFVEFPIEPAKQEFTPDDVCYEVSGFHTQDIEVARKIAEVLSLNRSKLVTVEYNYKVGSEYKYLKKNLNDWDAKCEIATIKIFKPETYESLQAAMGKFAESKSEYEAHKKKYDEYKKKRGELTAAVAETIQAHWKLSYKLEEYKKLMARYIELANGDKEIAMRFFKKSLAEKEWGATEQWFLYKMGYLPAEQEGGAVVATSEIESRAIQECGGY